MKQTTIMGREVEDLCDFSESSYIQDLPWLVEGALKGAVRSKAGEWALRKARLWALRTEERLPDLRFADLGRATPSGELRYARSILAEHAVNSWANACKARSALEQTLEVLGFTVQDSCWRSFVERAARLYFDGLFEKYIKWHLICLANRMMGQPLPEVPDLDLPRYIGVEPVDGARLVSVPGSFLGGQGGRILGLMARQGAWYRDRDGSSKPVRGRRSWAVTLLVAKRAFPAGPDFLLDAAYDKLAKALSSDNSHLLEQARLLGVDLEREVERTVEEVFRGERWVAPTWSLPSCSASYYSTRRTGGPLMELWDELPSIPFLRAIEGPGQQEGDGVSSWQSEITATLGTAVKNELQMEFGILDENPEDAFLAELRRRANPLGPHRVRAVAFHEPLKVRTVTGGPSVEYHLAMQLQSFMHGTLRKHPTFALIGGCPIADALEQLRVGSGEMFLSGDYEAATDNLVGRLSQVAANALAHVTRMPPWWRWLLVSTLTHHRVELPDGREFDQRTGQLMGSPTSFPILCVINAAICRRAMELDKGRRMSLRSCPLIVNGDDCALRGGDRLQALWGALSSAAGLKPSAGKVFFASDFVQINSRTFNVERPLNFFGFRDVTGFSPIPFVHMGLLTGNNVKGHKVVTKEEQGLLLSMDPGACSMRLREDAGALFTREIEDLFVRNWKPVLDGAPKGCSWFLPKALGGLGVHTSRPLADCCSQQQLRTAAFLMSNCSPELDQIHRAGLRPPKESNDFWQEAELREKHAGLTVGAMWVDEDKPVESPQWTTWIIKRLYFSQKYVPERYQSEWKAPEPKERLERWHRSYLRCFKKAQAHSLGIPSDQAILAYHRKKAEKVYLPFPTTTPRINQLRVY